jgi:hypothetical protein
MGKATRKSTPSRTKRKTEPKAIVEQHAAPTPREPIVHVVKESEVTLSAGANLVPPNLSQTHDATAPLTVGVNSAAPHLNQILQAQAAPKINSKSPGQVGRHRSLTPEQIEEGIRILQSHGKMSLEAACATLKVEGIETSKSSINRLVWTRAYRSGSK